MPVDNERKHGGVADLPPHGRDIKVEEKEKIDQLKALRFLIEEMCSDYYVYRVH
jgi:hypothetical protein